MLRPFGSEQGNFSLFLLLVMISSALFTLPAQSFWASGGAMVIWGAFGFWRLAVISFYAGRSSKIASLPARLMATLDEREHRLRSEGHSRLHHLDIQLWFALGCFYALWVGINYIAPAPLESVTTLQPRSLISRPHRSLATLSALNEKNPRKTRALHTIRVNVDGIMFYFCSGVKPASSSSIFGAQ